MALKKNPAFNSKRLELLDDIPNLAREHLREKASVKKQKAATSKPKRSFTVQELNVLWLFSNRPEIDDTGITNITGAGRTTINRLRKLNAPKVELVKPDVEDTHLKKPKSQSSVGRL